MYRCEITGDIPFVCDWGQRAEHSITSVKSPPP
jgi:hypothetical protein